MRTRPLTLIALLLLAAVSLALAQSTRPRTGTKQPAKQQPVPSTDPQPETALKWLQAKYRVNGTVQARWREAVTHREMQWLLIDPDMTYSGCSLELRHKERWGGDPSKASDVEVKDTFSLEDLSDDIPIGQAGFDNAIGPLPSKLTLTTKDGQKKITEQRTVNGPSSLKTSNNLSIYFDSADIAKRAANALRDAILACGGTKEAY